MTKIKKKNHCFFQIITFLAASTSLISKLFFFFFQKSPHIFIAAYLPAGRLGKISSPIFVNHFFIFVYFGLQTQINISLWESCWSSATYDLWLKAESWSLNFKIVKKSFKIQWVAATFWQLKFFCKALICKIYIDKFKIKMQALSFRDFVKLK